MGQTLPARDYAAALAFIERLGALQDGLPHWLAREITTLVGADHVTWNDVALTVPWTTVVQWPDLPHLERRTAAFSRHMLEHPNLLYWMRTGDLSAIKLSDRVSPQALHRLPLYDALYRELGYEDQFNLFLGPPRPTAQALGLARDRRSFTERDRAMLDLVHPHIARAYANLQALTRARRAIGNHEHIEDALGLCIIELEAGHRPVELASRARAWLRAYFDDPARGDQLPEALRAWLKSARRDAATALVRRRRERQLVVRRFTGVDGATLLLLEERTAPEGTRHLREIGVTAREIEVLLEAEKGKTNDEIAATLFISPRTVKKHFQHVFGKLGVANRTAAVVRLRSAPRRR